MQVCGTARTEDIVDVVHIQGCGTARTADMVDVGCDAEVAELTCRDAHVEVIHLSKQNLLYLY